MTDILGADRWRVETGDALTVLRGLPEECVQCVVTSPPYWGLRDYGADGQIGLEGTPEEYVAGLVEVFAEVRRVLREDGTCWCNLGDAYNSGTNAPRRPSETDGYGKHGYWTNEAIDKRVNAIGLKPKDLVGIPWRVAFALQADGWWLRSDIVWAKPNPMPESVTDRPTRAHEYLFLLTKAARYWYDADAVREPGSPNSVGGGNGERGRKTNTLYGPNAHLGLVHAEPAGENGRNRRTVWTIPTQPFPGAHFATFPEALVEPCVLAGSAERSCPECGAPWVRVVERTDEPNTSAKGSRFDQGKTGARDGGDRTQPGERYLSETTGFRPGCDCGCEETVGSIVLDPFCGSGTTGAVAVRLGRRFIGIELNPEYVTMAERRVGAAERARQPVLFDAV